MSSVAQNTSTYILKIKVTPLNKDCVCVKKPSVIVVLWELDLGVCCLRKPVRVFPPLYMLRLLTQLFRWSGGKWRASARLGSAQCYTFSPLLKANVIFLSLCCLLRPGFRQS